MGMSTPVVCQECQTPLGGDSGTDTYSHLINCLHVSPGPLERIKEVAANQRGEYGKRVLHLVNAMLSKDGVSSDGGDD